MTPLMGLLSPVYWGTAYEIDDAMNGYTLTGGSFTREAHVAFTTGNMCVLVEKLGNDRVNFHDF